MKKLSWVSLLQINAFFLGLNVLAATNGFILPLLVQQFVGSEKQGAYFGQLRLWTLMLSIIVQSTMGAFSDSSTLLWGRRRPFIFGGALLTLAIFWLAGNSPLFHEGGTFGLLFLVVMLIQFSYNAAIAGQNGLIPDLVPPSQRGLASGVKALLETTLPLLLIAGFTGAMISRGELWPALRIALLVFGITALFTLTVKENRWQNNGRRFDWGQLIRLFLMAACFTAIILALGELMRFLLRRPLRNPQDLVQPFILGLVGLVCIVASLFAGTWFSLRIGLGKTAFQENPSYRWWVIHRLAFLTGVFNMGVFAIYFIQSRLNISGAAAAAPGTLFMALLGIWISIVTLPGGWLADRIGRKPLAMASGWLAALGTLVLLSTTNMVVIFIGGGLLGFAAGLFFSSSWALGTDLIADATASKYLGIQNIAAAGAGAVGAYIGGPIADFFSHNFPQVPGLGYVVLFGMFGFLCLLSSLALTRVHTPTLSPAESPKPALEQVS